VHEALAIGDRIQFTDKKRHIYNGNVGTITGLNASLESATADQLAHVEILGTGYGLGVDDVARIRWPVQRAGPSRIADPMTAPSTTAAPATGRASGVSAKASQTQKGASTHSSRVINPASAAGIFRSRAGEARALESDRAEPAADAAKQAPR